MQIDRMLVLRLYKSSLCAEIQRKYDLRFKTFTSSEFPGRDKNSVVTSQEVLSSNAHLPWGTLKAATTLKFMAHELSTKNARFLSAGLKKLWRIKYPCLKRSATDSVRERNRQSENLTEKSCWKEHLDTKALYRESLIQDIWALTK